MDVNAELQSLAVRAGVDLVHDDDTVPGTPDQAVAQFRILREQAQAATSSIDPQSAAAEQVSVSVAPHVMPSAQDTLLVRSVASVIPRVSAARLTLPLQPARTARRTLSATVPVGAVPVTAEELRAAVDPDESNHARLLLAGAMPPNLYGSYHPPPWRLV